MVTLQLKVSGGGPVLLNFSSGTISGTHLFPPADGSSLGLLVSDLQATVLSVASSNGGENMLMVDVTEGPDPIWLAFTIDCTNGGSVSVGFPGSPTVRVNSGSFLGLEYNNGNPPPILSQGPYS